MSKAYTAGEGVLHAWGIGGLADYWMSAVIYSFVSIVFVSSYEMDPGWVAVAMMLPRLINIVVDPLLGRISDNTHTPWGRRRPFIFVTGVLGAALVVAVWWMPLSWVDKPLMDFTLPWTGKHYAMPWSFPYLLCFTTLLYAVLGTFQMSHGALGLRAFG